MLLKRSSVPDERDGQGLAGRVEDQGGGRAAGREQRAIVANAELARASHGEDGDTLAAVAQDREAGPVARLRGRQRAGDRRATDVLEEDELRFAASETGVEVDLRRRRRQEPRR